MSYFIRSMLCAILIVALMLTFGVGIRWIVGHILSNFLSSVLIVLFTISSFAVGAIIISIFIEGERSVEIITAEIKSTYPGVGESPVAKWRRKHKKCKWCIYCKHVEPPAMCCPSFCECIAKDKIINEDIPRPFCSLFALKKEE